MYYKSLICLLPVVHAQTDSSFLGPMQGDTHDRIAETVEASACVLLFISRDTKIRPNCRQEAEYAHQLKKKGKLQVIFIMMDPTYTTVR